MSRRHIKRNDGSWGPGPEVPTPRWTVKYNGKERKIRAPNAKSAAFQVAELIGAKFPNTTWPVQFTLSREGRTKVHTIEAEPEPPSDPSYSLTLID